MAYHSLESITAYCKEHGTSFYEAVLADDREERDTTAEESLSRMAVLWDTMKETDASYDAALRSSSGLSGGQGARMEAYGKQGGGYCCPVMNAVMETALRQRSGDFPIRK